MPTTKSSDAVDEETPSQNPAPPTVDVPATSADGGRRGFRSTVARAVVFGILPAIALLLAWGIAWLKWWEGGNRAAEAAGAESVKAATDSTIALLSYQPDTVDKELVSARDLLTGAFRDSYTSLTNDVVIPGAKQKHISAVATVPAAAAVSTTKNHAVVLVMVNQTTVVGTDSPTQTATSIKVTLDKVAGRWLISDFNPI
jgi:Mce-associated membrane protein